MRWSLPRVRGLLRRAPTRFITAVNLQCEAEDVPGMAINEGLRLAGGRTRGAHRVHTGVAAHAARVEGGTTRTYISGISVVSQGIKCVPCLRFMIRRRGTVMVWPAPVTRCGRGPGSPKVQEDGRKS